jgi:hypothetical protein
MSAKELYRLLDNYAGAYETVESFDGVRIIRFEVEEDAGFGLLPLERASDEQVIAYADSQGYQLTLEDVQEIRSGCLASPLWGMLNNKDETVSRAVNDFLDAFER